MTILESNEVLQAITVNSIYKLTKNSNNADIYEYVDAAAPLTTSVLDSSASPSITCSNILKEIAYTVNVEEKPAEDGISKDPYFNIVSITADVVV